MVVTDLCAQDIDQVRECVPGEAPGVVITRYANLASGYEKTVFVVPLLDHFAATSNPESLPVLSSGATLKGMQIEYWREHLKAYFPPFSPARYEALRNEQKKFRAGRTVRQLLTLEFLGNLLAVGKPHGSTEPIALLDPLTQELIPNGRWREAIGAGQTRDYVIITVPADRRSEMRLVPFIAKSQLEHFNVVSNNCSDFVNKGLVAVFGDQMHPRSRWLDEANAWITSPLLVATNFVNYSKSANLPISVKSTPIMAGTRWPATGITSISRGALVPSPNQGKIAFGLRIYINVLNPVLGATAYAVTALSRFTDIDKLVRERSAAHEPSSRDEHLSALPGKMDGPLNPQRERVVHFGTTSCWKEKQAEYAALISQAEHSGALTKTERSLALSQGRPFLLPRLYEKLGAAHPGEGAFMAGVRSCLAHECGSGQNLGFMPEPIDTGQDAVVPSRSMIESMSQSAEPSDRAVAFRLMLSVINGDLASEPAKRRNSGTFDEDWQLFLTVSARDGLDLSGSDAASESLAVCSIRQFDGGRRTDAVQDDQRVLRRIKRWSRQVIFSPAR
ncbi:MAG TPA: hypothetical protein VM578_03650 [Candidatus Saccharimonadales bacterium]|nr:hypothetical protein [Candidatus Saccharimonadales bacterium]